MTNETKMGENEWVAIVADRLRPVVAKWDVTNDGLELVVETQKKLLYANEVLGYSSQSDDQFDTKSREYETDLLITAKSEDDKFWWPLVVVECKYKSVITHDSLTYSAKAATHKQVHPYIRYGFLIGAFNNKGKAKGVPGRLYAHGHHFDFMVAWKDSNPTDLEWDGFCDVLEREADAA